MITRAIRKIFIANRGEIACRIAVTAKRLGLGVCGVYTPQDSRTRAKRMLEEMRLLPAGDLSQNYLNGPLLIQVAKEMGADAIHPGYGFLAENSDFAEAVLQSGLIWIGPNPDAMRKLGGKITAKEIAEAAAVPVAPWIRIGEKPSAEDVRKILETIGLPLLIKAAHGGGGRGQRIVNDEMQFTESLRTAQSESLRSFGSKEVFIEKFLQNPRHVEVQILADEHGNVVALGERDCTLQRRNQKIIEESPATILDSETRHNLHQSAKSLAASAGYTNAGTVEFLVEGRNFYFMEMNTRLQVEHPVTEQIWGVDLVALQIRLAEGANLQQLLPALPGARPSGHAIELRLTAEDPARQFLPTPGPLVEFEVPESPDIRLETGFEAGDVIAQEYDSLFAKLIVHGDTRQEVIERLSEVLDQITIGGMIHNKYYLQRLLKHPEFQQNAVYTRWIDAHPELATGDDELEPDLGYWARRWSSELFVQRKIPPTLPPLSLNHFLHPKILRDFYPSADHGKPSPQGLIRVSGEFLLEDNGKDYASGWINRFEVCINFNRLGQRRFMHAGLFEADDIRTHHGPITALVPGVVLDVRAAPNDVIEPQAPILIIEAMKIEMPLSLPVAAKITSVTVKQGDRIQPGQTLVTWEPPA